MTPEGVRLRQMRKSWYDRHREKSRLPRDPGNVVFVPIERISAIRDDDWHRRIRKGPDTRDLTGRLLGDPLPGQSALDVGGRA